MDTFEIDRGMRQGCPLLPLLFALTIVPLAALLRADEGIKGCRVNALEEKTSLYADDMLIYLAEAEGSLTNALDRISGFGRYSGFKVNWNKSIVFRLNPEYTPRMPLDVPLQVVSCFQYLGVEIQLPLNTYISNNISPLLLHLRENLQTWNRLPLKLLGRINMFKMIYLPRFLYLFWRPPFYISKKMFTGIKRYSLPFFGALNHLECS